MTIQRSVFTKIFADRSVTETFELAAEIGFDGVEPMCRDPHVSVETPMEQVEEWKAKLDELGLSVPCLATYTGYYVEKDENECEAELEDLERFCRMADILDCDLVRHWAGGPSVHEADPDHFETAAHWMRRAADVAAEYDKTLAIEIHAGGLTETADSTVDLLDRIARDNVGAIHDAGNMFIMDTDFGAQSVETLGDDIVHVHVKDEARFEDDSLPGAFEVETRHGTEVFRHTMLGQGETDHEPLFEALVETGYDGAVSVECHVPQKEADDDVVIAKHELREIDVILERIQ
jgi:sugar phosphate isomerase/epimerase